MKKVVFGFQIAALMIQVLAVALLGIEIQGHMNPGRIMIEAVIIGTCLAVNIICVFLRLYMGKRCFPDSEEC